MIAHKLGKYLNTRPDVLNRLSDRIYPNRVPQQAGNVYPRAIVSAFSGQPDYSLSGEIEDLAKMVQVDVEAESQYEANEVADLIRQEISFFEGTWDDTIVKSCTVQNERDQDFPPTDGSDQWTFKRIIDYQVTYVR